MAQKDLDLNELGKMIAAELRAIRFKQANETFPGSKLAANIKVVPVVSGGNLSFRTTTVSYGKYQDVGTLQSYQRLGRTRGPHIPHPKRRGKSKTWKPNGIRPSFWKSIGEADNQRLAMMVEKKIVQFVQGFLPKIRTKVS